MKVTAVGAATVLLACGTAFSQPAESDETLVNIAVIPIAQLDFIGTPLLSLTVPPAASTIPSTGVDFQVTGNSFASVSAEPDGFVQIPTFDYPGGEQMGRAISNGNPLGYRLRLDFPSAGAAGSPVASAGLPGYEAGSTVPPLTVDLMATGGTRNGRLHLEASHTWTPDGGVPLPGVYVGGVTLTVTAD